MGATYPASLPDLDFASISLSREDNVIRSATNAAAGKTRRRYTNVPRVYTQQAIMSETQLNTFESFYYNTLAGGALPFDHPEPLDGATVECRFTGPPSQRLVAHKGSADAALWELQLTYEVLG